MHENEKSGLVCGGDPFPHLRRERVYVKVSHHQFYWEHHVCVHVVVACEMDFRIFNVLTRVMHETDTRKSLYH